MSGAARAVAAPIGALVASAPCALSAVERFAALKHSYELRDLACARLRRFHRADAVEDGVAVGSRERGEEGGRFGIGLERGRKIGGGPARLAGA